nr:MAG TPA: hypothetical protein [Caudoviricetes sp.]
MPQEHNQFQQVYQLSQSLQFLDYQYLHLQINML